MTVPDAALDHRAHDQIVLDRWVRGLVRGLDNLGPAVHRRVGDGTLGLDHRPGTTVHLDIDRIESFRLYDSDGCRHHTVRLVASMSLGRR